MAKADSEAGNTSNHTVSDGVDGNMPVQRKLAEAECLLRKLRARVYRAESCSRCETHTPHNPCHDPQRKCIYAFSQAHSDRSRVMLLNSAGNKFVRLYVLLMIYHGARCITWQYMLCKPTSTTVFMPQLVPRRKRSRPQRCGRPINDASAQPCKKCKPLYRNTPPTHPEAC